MSSGRLRCESPQCTHRGQWQNHRDTCRERRCRRAGCFGPTPRRAAHSAPWRHRDEEHVTILGARRFDTVPVGSSFAVAAVTLGLGAEGRRENRKKKNIRKNIATHLSGLGQPETMLRLPVPWLPLRDLIGLPPKPDTDSLQSPTSLIPSGRRRLAECEGESTGRKSARRCAPACRERRQGRVDPDLRSVQEPGAACGSFTEETP